MEQTMQHEMEAGTRYGLHKLPSYACMVHNAVSSSW